MTGSNDNANDIAAVADGALRKGQSLSFSTGRRLPSATLIVYRDRISITDKWPHRTFTFPRAHVMGVRQHFLLGEVQIVHNMPDYPPYMGFSTGGAADFIVEGLKRFGYPVEEGGAGIVGVPFLQKLHWPSIIGPAAASVFAVVLAVLFKTRSLPFLRPPTIVSAGRVVPTEEFSAFCARIFLISAVVFAVMTAVLIGIQLWQRRKANSG